MQLYGTAYTKEELMKYTGNLSQLGGFRTFTLTGGRADGTRGIQLDNGVLSLTLLPSRCLDIAHASYKGIPFGYISKSGIRHPSYFTENKDRGFLDNFFGGFLTTSGLNNIGAASESAGVSYGTHGTISNTPVEHYTLNQYWEEDALWFEISAVVRFSRFYAEDMQLIRTIRTRLGSSEFILQDEIENQDFTPFPLFFLYHINLGFPFASPASRIVMPSMEKCIPRTAHAADTMPRMLTFEEPAPDAEESCYYCHFSDDTVHVSLENPQLTETGLRFSMTYPPAQFPVFTEWKMTRCKEYVCGFAPGTNYLEGRQAALDHEPVRWLQPMEKATFTTRFSIEPMR